MHSQKPVVKKERDKCTEYHRYYTNLEILLFVDFANLSSALLLSVCEHINSLFMSSTSTYEHYCYQ